MLFVQRIKAYKISSKFVKSAGAAVLSLGFPLGEVENGNLSLSVISEKIGAKGFKENDRNIVFSLNDAGMKNDYEEWKETIHEGIVKEMNEPALCRHQPAADEIISMIKNFDLANSTPMDAMRFIHQLKNAITHRA